MREESGWTLALASAESNRATSVSAAPCAPAEQRGVGAGDGQECDAAVDVADAAYPRHGQAVIEPDHQLLVHPHPPAYAGHPAHQVRPAVRQRHQLEDLDDTLVGLPDGLEHEGVALVAPLRAHPGALDQRVGGREQPAPVLRRTEQGAEHRRRVEPGQAEPVDAAVERDVRRRVAVGQQAVVADRQEVPLAAGGPGLLDGVHEDTST